MLKGHLDMIMLAALAAGPAHGYAVIEEIKRRSSGAFELPEGTICWTIAESGRRRHVYELTKRGRRELGERRAVWEQFSEAIAGLFKGSRSWQHPT